MSFLPMITERDGVPVTTSRAVRREMPDFIGGGYTVALIPYRLLQSLTACERGLAV